MAININSNNRPQPIFNTTASAANKNSAETGNKPGLPPMRTSADAQGKSAAGRDISAASDSTSAINSYEPKAKINHGGKGLIG